MLNTLGVVEEGGVVTAEQMMDVVASLGAATHSIWPMQPEVSNTGRSFLVPERGERMGNDTLRL